MLLNFMSRSFKMFYNVGSYTQGRIVSPQARSSRKAARAENCTPKTTEPALDG